MSDVILERDFPITTAQVFMFITQPEFLISWWGPEGATLESHNLDFTRTGPWYAIIIGESGKRFKHSGAVTAVNSPSSVEFTWAWHDETDARGHESNVRFEVIDNGNGSSKFRLTHSGLPNEDARTHHAAGWTVLFDKLDARILAFQP